LFFVYYTLLYLEHISYENATVSTDRIHLD
jgi:hypothetical protein